LKQPRRALDVREEQGDRAGREVWHSEPIVSDGADVKLRDTCETYAAQRRTLIDRREAADYQVLLVIGAGCRPRCRYLAGINSVGR
jgi:hypothetical protein